MLSAGLLGGPGIGYKQDYFASEKLVRLSDETYDRYVADGEKRFLIFPPVRGLDSAKVAVVRDPGGPGKELDQTVERLDQMGVENAQVTALNQWWRAEGKPNAAVDRPAVNEATVYGGQMALIYTALIPAFMALCYLGLVIYFRAQGGYRQVHIDEEEPVEKYAGEEYTGGVEAPVA